MTHDPSHLTLASCASLPITGKLWHGRGVQAHGRLCAAWGCGGRAGLPWSPCPCVSFCAALPVCRLARVSPCPCVSLPLSPEPSFPGRPRAMPPRVYSADTCHSERGRVNAGARTPEAQALWPWPAGGSRMWRARGSRRLATDHGHCRLPCTISQAAHVYYITGGGRVRYRRLTCVATQACRRKGSCPSLRRPCRSWPPASI